MRLCIYPGLTSDRPSATFQLTTWSRIERVVRKRERQISYRKRTVRRGWRKPKGEVLEKRGGEMGRKVEEVAPLKLPRNCSYKFVRIRLHSSVREIWLMPKSDQLVELILYRPFSSLYHSPGTSVGEQASSEVKSESLLANRSGLWEEATLEIENSAFRHLLLEIVVPQHEKLWITRL